MGLRAAGDTSAIDAAGANAHIIIASVQNLTAWFIGKLLVALTRAPVYWRCRIIFRLRERLFNLRQP
jgi:hypothetical protein